MATFLKNLFTPKWQHSNPDVRLTALDQITEANILAQLAKEDAHQAVRLKAIQIIQKSEDLLALFNDKASEIKQAAIEQYLTITLHSQNHDDRIQKLAEINDTQVLMTIATFAPEQTLAQAAVSQIKDEATLVEFILSSPSSKSRSLAAAKVTIKEHLKTIEQAFLNKDKSLVRLVKNKLADIQDEEEQEIARQANIEKLLTDAKTLSEQVFSPTYAGQIALLKQSWEQVSADTQQNQQFLSNIEKCKATLKAHQAEQAKQDAQNAAQQKAQKLQLETLDTLQAITAQYKSSAPTTDELNKALSHAQDNWKQANSLSSQTDNQLNKEYENLLKPLISLQNSLAFLDNTAIDFKPLHTCLESKVLSDLKAQQKNITNAIKTINWPKDFPKPKTLNSYFTLKDEINQCIDDLQKDKKQLLNVLNKALNQLEKAIEQGQIKQAKNLQTNIRKQFDQLDADNTKNQRIQYQTLVQSLDELKDWQGFATLPKFEALIHSMNALVNVDMPVKDLANAIHDLQEQWKTLGSLPNQKQQQALWQTFKQAADNAYEPCQAHFEEMAKVRHHNLEQRTVICNELEQYFQLNDWENADWKSVQQILDKAHSEFKKFSPVDRTEKKATLDRFHNAIQAIHGKLVEHFKENAAEKQALIDKAVELNSQEDIQQAIETCKDLQEQWKLKGNAGRAERQLWQAFRKECDALFEKRSAANQARKQQYDDAISQANQIVDELLSSTQNSNKESLNAINQAEQTIKELTLPKKVRLGVEKRLADLQQHVKQNIQQANVKAQHNLWLNAQAFSLKLGQAEQVGDSFEELTDALHSTELPPKVKAIFEKRLSQSTQQENLKELCLELELILDAPSPETDQAQRMALQVARLQKNMGKKLPSTEEQLRELQCRWFATIAKTQEYSELHERFFNTLNQYYSAS